MSPGAPDAGLAPGGRACTKAAVISVLAGGVHCAPGAIRVRYLFRLLYRFAPLAILTKVLGEWRARRRDAAEHME